MSYSALHTSFKPTTKGQASVPAYWLMLGNDRNCDRSQEISTGSVEIVDEITKI